MAAYQAGASFDDAVRPFALLHKRMWWEVRSCAAPSPPAVAGPPLLPSPPPSPDPGAQVAVRGEGLTREQLAEEEGPYKYLAATTAALLCRALCGADPRRAREGELRKDRSTERVLGPAEAAGAVEEAAGGGDAVCVDVITLQGAPGSEGGGLGPEPPALGLEYLPCFQPGFLALVRTRVREEASPGR